MQAYQTDHEGFFVGIVEADPDPLEDGSWLIPGGAVTSPPPYLTGGQRAQWDGNEWRVVEPEPEVVPEPEPEPTEEEILAAWRATATLTFSQLLIGLEKEKWISTAEAEDWLLLRILPEPIESVIQSLPEEDRFAARARAVAPSTVERLHFLVTGMAEVAGKTPEEMDEFFRSYKNV